MAMIRRRAAAAGIHAQIGNHTFQATGITAYIENGGQLEHAPIVEVACWPCAAQVLRPGAAHQGTDHVEVVAASMRC